MDLTKVDYIAIVSELGEKTNGLKITSLKPFYIYSNGQVLFSGEGLLKKPIVNFFVNAQIVTINTKTKKIHFLVHSKDIDYLIPKSD